jgi:hypothetical protein
MKKNLSFILKTTFMNMKDFCDSGSASTIKQTNMISSARIPKSFTPNSNNSPLYKSIVIPRFDNRQKARIISKVSYHNLILLIDNKRKKYERGVHKG